jgi:hypothetical protein
MERPRRSEAASRRAGERGAALVEAVVVVPVFIMLFAGMIFLHDVVAKTQRTQLAARQSAWTEAMPGCSGGSEVDQPDYTSKMDTAPGSDVSLTATPRESTGTSDDSVTVSIAGSGPSAVASSADPSFSQSIHSKAIVMCNAETQPGKIPDVFKWFISGNDLSLIFTGGP